MLEYRVEISVRVPCRKGSVRVLSRKCSVRVPSRKGSVRVLSRKCSVRVPSRN